MRSYLWRRDPALFEDALAETFLVASTPARRHFDRRTTVVDRRRAQHAAVPPMAASDALDLLRAHSDGDGSQTAAAELGFARVRAMMPVHQPGSSEDTGGYDAGSLALLDRIVRDQRSGAARSTEQYLAANCR